MCCASYVNSADLDQTVKEPSDQGLHCLLFHVIRKKSMKKKTKTKKTMAKKVWDKVFKMLGHLPYNDNNQVYAIPT